MSAQFYQQWQQWDEYLNSTQLGRDMKLDQMLTSKYLKQSDVDGEVLVTVEAMKKANVAREDEAAEYMFTLKFKEFDKPMVLNSTNTKRLFKFLGDDSDNWPGQQVVLYVDTDVEYGGNIVGGLRVRAARSKIKPRNGDNLDEGNRKAAAAAADSFNDDVPF
jgi:hypothetical protein